jgi:hypothetical protein
MAWSEYIKAKHDLRGPYGIECLGEQHDEVFTNCCGKRVRTFAMRIIASDGDVVVHRRFKQLREFVLAVTTEPVHVRLRGITYTLSKDRREAAVRELFKYAQAALDADPLASSPALRNFLALDPLISEVASPNDELTKGRWQLCCTRFCDVSLFTGCGGRRSSSVGACQWKLNASKNCLDKSLQQYFEELFGQEPPGIS